MEDNQKGFTKVLKWAGIIALVALPVMIILKKRKTQEAYSTLDDEANIFSDELKQ